jgi:osmotically-inducible protein OsmY
VQARYFTDPMLRGSEVDVAAEGGVVTLSGTVVNEAARAQAVTLAQQVDGVTRVENKLEVGTAAAASSPQPPARSAASSTAISEPPRTAAAQFDAAWTTTKIQAQYFVDPDVKGRNIDVTTDTNGRVTLRGRVDSEAAHKEALRIAKETEGVREVVDELTVETSAAEPHWRSAWTPAAASSRCQGRLRAPPNAGRPSPSRATRMACAMSTTS